MPVGGLRTWLAEKPDGTFGDDLDWDDVAVWIRKKHFTDQENNRRKVARKHHEFFIGQGEEYMWQLVEKVHTDKQVIELRQQWVEVANHVNPLRRLYEMLSVTYALPAKRVVDDEGGNKRYEALVLASRQHEVAQNWCMWGNFHKQLIVGVRIRTNTRGEKEPKIDVIPPSQFWALASPVDPTKLLALGMELDTDLPRRPDDIPKWFVMTDVEQFYMTETGFIIKPSIVEDHEWDRMPYLLLSVDPPLDGLIDRGAGKNAVAAHQAIWFTHVLLAKETKSATKIPVIAGDITNVALRQAIDTEIPFVASDGTIVSAINMGMDLDQFRDNANYLYEGTAADHNLPPQLLHHAGVQSAQARELMRAPLKEMRRKQEIYWRAFEHEFAEIQSMVMKREMPIYAFDTEGHRVNFAELMTALDPKTDTEVFEHKRRLGLTNTLAQLIKQDPDLDEEGALEQLLVNIGVEEKRVEFMRDLIRLNSGLNAPVVTEPPSPEGSTTEAGRGFGAGTPPEKGAGTPPPNGRGKKRRRNA